MTTTWTGTAAQIETAETIRGEWLAETDKLRQRVRPMTSFGELLVTRWGIRRPDLDDLETFIGTWADAADVIRLYGRTAMQYRSRDGRAVFTTWRAAARDSE